MAEYIYLTLLYQAAVQISTAQFPQSPTATVRPLFFL